VAPPTGFYLSINVYTPVLYSGLRLAYEQYPLTGNFKPGANCISSA